MLHMVHAAAAVPAPDWTNAIPVQAPGLPWWPVVAVVVMIVMINVAAHKVPALHIFWSIGGSVVLLTIAVLDGATWRDLGLAPSTWIAGLAWGFGAIALVFAIYAFGARLPKVRQMFGDQKIAGMRRWQVYFKTLVDLPLGTVWFEEIAFRGVLWAMLCRRTDWWHATWITALMFGLWHILGSLDLHERNPGLVAARGRPRLTQLKVVSLAVINTAIGGLVFAALRIVSGSLFAPMGFHWATNGWGYLFARRIYVTNPGPAVAE